MILSIDTETSNLPARGMEPSNPRYPWAVHIGAVLFDDDGRDHAIFSTGVRADGRSISAEAQRVHGISTVQAGRTGIPEIVALSAVCHLASQAQLLVGYNIEFDRDVIVAAIIRNNQDPHRLLRPGLQVIDLMKPAAACCKLPTDHESGTYRWPSLDEACKILLGEAIRDGIHSALDDVLRAKRLFFWLREHGALDMGTADAA